MTGSNAEWRGALRELRKGDTKPLGKLLQSGAAVPAPVATLIGLMLAPPEYDTGPTLVLQKYKGKRPDGFGQLVEMVEVNHELKDALNEHNGVMKRALHRVGESRWKRGLSGSRSKLLKLWGDPKLSDGARAHLRRLFLEMSLMPSPHFTALGESAGAEQWVPDAEPPKRTCRRKKS